MVHNTRLNGLFLFLSIEWRGQLVSGLRHRVRALEIRAFRGIPLPFASLEMSALKGRYNCRLNGL